MRIIRIIVWLLMVCAISSSLVLIANTSVYEIAGLETRVDIAANSDSGTVVAIPPLGYIQARTHSVPIVIKAEIVGVNQTVIEKALSGSQTSGEYFDLLEKDAKAAARDFALRLLLLGALGGLIGSLLLTRRWFASVAATLIPILVTGLLVIAMNSQFDPTAFTQPRITGPLGSIPLLATSIEERMNPLDILKKDVVMVAGNLRKYSARIESWQPIEAEADTIRILSVSDIHNNPAGFSLVSRVTKDFDVDFIIDTGDITDYGTPIEASLLTQLSSVTVPYIFIPGNHDTPEIQKQLRSLPRVTVLNNNIVNQNGVSVFGASDPVSNSSRMEPLSDKELDVDAARLKKLISLLPVKPMIVAVHNPLQAADIVGYVPVILSGHTHKSSIKTKKGSILIESGSTGAEGIRALQKEGQVEQLYSLQLVYYNTKRKEVVAVDSIQVVGLSGEFTLVRKMMAEANP